MQLLIYGTKKINEFRLSWRYKILSETYIHYGHRWFEKDLYTQIRNRKYFAKPFGGLWASNVNSKFGWKDWCKVEEFRDCDKENSFSFTLSDNAKILRIKSIRDIENLPIVDRKSSWICLDFEQLSKDYDVIEANISNSDELYFALYGWDCDSILVMNPDVIQEI